MFKVALSVHSLGGQSGRGYKQELGTLQVEVQYSIFISILHIRRENVCGARLQHRIHL